jgi:hypothetical protein
MIILDTSFLIDFFRGVPETESCIGDEIYAVTTLSYHEIFEGVKRANARKEGDFFRDFFEETRVLEYTLAAAEASSTIAARLHTLGTPVNALDILIAGIAVAEGAGSIATRDKDFLTIGEVVDLEIRLYNRGG